MDLRKSLVFVWPAFSALLSKHFEAEQYVQTLNPSSLGTCVLVCVINLKRFRPLSVTLALTEAHMVSGKPNLPVSVCSHTF